MQFHVGHSHMAPRRLRAALFRFLLFNPHEMAHFGDHPPHRRVISLLHRLIQTTETERFHRGALILRETDRTPEIRDSNGWLAHDNSAFSRRRKRSAGSPRRAATSAAVSNSLSARSAARV